MPGQGAQVLPLEIVPVPGHGAQASALAPTKGHVQIGAHTWAPCLGIRSERGLRMIIRFLISFVVFGVKFIAHYY